MKTRKMTQQIVLLFFVSALIFSACKKKTTEEVQPTPTPTNIVPSTFKVDVPSSIKSENPSGVKTAESDTLSGSVIYRNIRHFIYVGCAAADVVQGIMTAISANHINQAMTLDYVSNEDHRSKHLVVTEGATFNNTAYQFKLTVTDGSSPALQVFWNTSPVKGVAIISAYDWNKNMGINFIATRYMVEYSEAGENSYQKQMTVSIVNYPQLNPLDMHYINNMKLFVGKNGSLLTLRGNSNHPNAVVVDTASAQRGKDYAFVAHSDDALNIGTVKVAITPTNFNTTANIFTTYSVYNVLNSAIHNMYDSHYTPNGIPQNIVNSYLKNTDQPAYFTSPQGFVSCGATVPAGFSSTFIDLSSLTPYVPNDIKNLAINFQ